MSGTHPRALHVKRTLARFGRNEGPVGSGSPHDEGVDVDSRTGGGVAVARGHDLQVMILALKPGGSSVRAASTSAVRVKSGSW